jgi:hypothetical protein
MTESEQARADAIADAETLRRFVFRGKRTPTTYGGSRSFATVYAVTNPDIRRAFWAGESVVQSIGYATYGASVYPVATLLSKVREAAHAAFRAVPGLRGEPK